MPYASARTNDIWIVNQSRQKDSTPEDEFESLVNTIFVGFLTEFTGIESSRSG